MCFDLYEVIIRAAAYSKGRKYNNPDKDVWVECNIILSIKIAENV